MHEEWYRGTVAGALEHFAAPRGEFTLVLDAWDGGGGGGGDDEVRTSPTSPAIPAAPGRTPRCTAAPRAPPGRRIYAARTL